MSKSKPLKPLHNTIRKVLDKKGTFKIWKILQHKSVVHQINLPFQQVEALK